MTLVGRIRVRGLDCSLRRPSVTETDTGERTAWAAAGTVRVELEPISAELAQRVFGTEALIRLRAYTAASGTQAQLGDGMVIPSGPYAGSYRVRGRVGPFGATTPPNAHVELGLVSTPESLEVTP